MEETDGLSSDEMIKHRKLIEQLQKHTEGLESRIDGFSIQGKGFSGNMRTGIAYNPKAPPDNSV